MAEQKLYIDGSWVDGVSVIEVVDRWDGSAVGTVHLAGPAQAIAAVDAAERAMKRGFPVHERSIVLNAVADHIAANAEVFAQSIKAEVGKPITASRTEVSRAIGTLRYAAEESKRLPAESVPLDAVSIGEGMIAYTVPEPAGIVAAITPFNFPLNLVIHKIGPAIAAGCAVLLKPSDKTKWTAGLLVKAFETAGLPAGYLNLVTGSPADVVTPWQQDDRVAVVTFTGSSAVGWQLKADSPRKRHILELGSNTAMVVAADADLDRAVPDTVSAGLANSGQACVSLQRVYIERAIAEDYLARLTEAFGAVVVGDPNDEATIVGPLVSDGEAERLGSWLEAAKAQGARVLSGGVVDGGVLSPTLVRDVTQSSTIVCEEVFGPVVSVIIVDDVDAAIAGVNDSKYGLNTAIYTSSLATALKFSREAQAGSVLVNVPPSFRADHMPYGGVKESGEGREGVKYAVAEMLAPKLVILKA